MSRNFTQQFCSVVDPDPYWIRIQELPGWIRIRIRNTDQDPHMQI